VVSARARAREKRDARGGSGNPRRSGGACRPFNDSFASPGNFTSRLIDYFILFYFRRLLRAAFPVLPVLPALPASADSSADGTRRYPRFYRRIAFPARDISRPRRIYDRITGNVLAAGRGNKGEREGGEGQSSSFFPRFHSWGREDECLPINVAQLFNLDRI